MSSGGGAPAPTSNYSTGTTGGSQETSAPAPGGKGGFPSAQSPYAQQQPQVYMPPQQPSFYQQAFPQQQAYTQSSFYAPQQQQGFMNPYSQNAYAQRRPYRSQSSPFNAPKPPGEMQYSGQYAPQAPAGLQNNPDYVAPGQMISDSWRRQPSDYQFAEYAGPTNRTPQYGGPGLGPPRLEQSGLGSLMGGMLDANDPMYGMPSAPPSMPVNEAGVDMNQAFNTYRKQMQDWQNKTGMTPDQWYAKRDEGIAFRNKQAAQSPVAAPPPISQAGQAVSTGSRTGLGALLGGY